MIAVGDHGGLALGEHAGLRRADARDVADRVHVRERGLERQRVDRDPAVDASARTPRRPRARGAPARRGTGRRASRRRRRAPRPCAPGRARARACSGCHSMPRSANAASSASDAAGDGGIGTRQRHHQRDLGLLAQPALGEVVVHQQRGLARRGRALERRRRHADDHPAAGEVGEHVAQRERAGHGVELVAALDQPGRRRRDRGRRRARPPGCRPRTSRRRSRRAWRRDRSRGSSACTNRTPGFTSRGTGDAPRRQSSRPNITSSFEKPKTKPSLRSISTTSTSAPNSSDSRRRQLQPAEPRTQHQDPHGPRAYRRGQRAAGVGRCTARSDASSGPGLRSRSS